MQNYDSKALSHEKDKTCSLQAREAIRILSKGSIHFLPFNIIGDKLCLQ